MVKQFTEEQKRRIMGEVEKQVKKHEERFHGGAVTRCNYYSECHGIEREERAAKDKEVSDARSSSSISRES